MTEEIFRQQVLDDLATVLHDQPEALRWVFSYWKYCHLIDDIVDEAKNEDTIRQAFAMGEALFTSPFYRQNCDYIYPVIRSVHFNFFISCEWEKSDEHWKRRHADLLRHSGNDVAVAILSLFCSDEDTLATAKRLKEYRTRITTIIKGRMFPPHYDTPDDSLAS